jgi:fatty acid desaturase
MVDGACIRRTRMDSKLNATWIPETRDGSPGAVDRNALLSGQNIVELSERNAARVAAVICLDLTLIIAAAVLCELFWTPWLYPLGVMFIGARQIGLASVALHDGAHGLLLRNRPRNDLLANALCYALFTPLLTEFSEYRKTHITHHQHTNTRNDPEFASVLHLYLHASPLRIAAVLLAQLSGLGFIRLMAQALRSGSWLRKSWILAVTLIVLCGVALSWHPIELFVLYWLVPFATWGLFINSVRALSEHFPPGVLRKHQSSAAIFLTRDILPSWFDRVFVTTRGVNYHLTHHLFPAVPFYRLESLQRSMAQTSAYQTAAHATHGYHRALAEIFLRR